MLRSFNSIEWIPWLGVSVWLAGSLSFNSIEWIRAYVYVVTATWSPSTFNSIEWILHLVVAPPVVEQHFQFHWMDSLDRANTCTPLCWNYLSIPLNGFQALHLHERGHSVSPFNSIEWILGIGVSGCWRSSWCFQFHWMDSWVSDDPGPAGWGAFNSIEWILRDKRLETYDFYILSIPLNGFSGSGCRGAGVLRGAFNSIEWIPNV